jgi:hypothetical protein
MIGAVRCALVAGSGAGVEIPAAAWVRDDADLLVFDQAVHRGEDAAERLELVILLDNAGESEQRAVAEIRNRYQRLVPLMNKASRGPRFRTVLARHRALYDLSRPRVRLDHEHALDAWQWLLRLEPDADLVLQIAALFRDVARLDADPPEAPPPEADYESHRRAHAERGRKLLQEVLCGLELDPLECSRAEELVKKSAGAGREFELQLLHDAEALSFFALTSWAFGRYFGAEHTRRKAIYTLRRMSPRARRLLARVELRVAEPVAGEIRRAVEVQRESARSSP